MCQDNRCVSELRDCLPSCPTAGDVRCADASLPRESVELLVGAELTRRAFTNACNIMQRHGFAKAWARWRQ